MFKNRLAEPHDGVVQDSFGKSSCVDGALLRVVNDEGVEAAQFQITVENTSP